MTYRWIGLSCWIVGLLAACSAEPPGAIPCNPMRDALCVVDKDSVLDSSTPNNRGDARVTNTPDARVFSRPDANLFNTPDAMVVNVPDGMVMNMPDGSVNIPDGSVNIPDGMVMNMPDGSVNMPDAGMCGQTPPSPSANGPCTAATVSCIQACADSACVGGCLQATPGCLACVNNAGTTCIADNGCQSETQDLLCCLENECAGAPDVGVCVQASCPAAPTAYNTCANGSTVSDACGSVFGPAYQGCFPATTTPDAGVGGDAGVRECAEPLAPVPDNLHTFCEAGTRTCIASATTQQEFAACLAADTATPLMSGGSSFDCRWCINYTQTSCVTNNGCGTEMGDLFCCIEDENCSDSSCVTANCGTESTAADTCSAGIGATCGSINAAAYNPCF